MTKAISTANSITEPTRRASRSLRTLGCAKPFTGCDQGSNLKVKGYSRKAHFSVFQKSKFLLGIPFEATDSVEMSQIWGRLRAPAKQTKRAELSLKWEEQPDSYGICRYHQTNETLKTVPQLITSEKHTLLSCAIDLFLVSLLRRCSQRSRSS